ncbi:bifunctional 4-hydroxy-2-oxoglutarate aldolase/2-dehydro-3-deoxy-phosphogluconate aldolase [Fodinicurvata sp. EGI_FJ10296]|uniref:bifunctional 4-hydroxy-2-oxoglutarate aldolase/2-dehydro-3-deoxy-phosphogluconate aldolase n=1 Tax=Fodinicurvata sp. EGI_FJ10296 TaxID=3231908 RepID=UPI0034539729
MTGQTPTIETVMTTAPVIPVVTVTDAETAVPLAAALVRGGLPVIEITLRTPAGIEAIRRISREVPDAIVGAGTVLNARDVVAAREAGAAFGVSPGLTSALIAALADHGDDGGRRWPFLPGIATASEAMAAMEAGYDRVKLFPATVTGGTALIKALSAPFPQLRFCPTGGITAETAGSFLNLPAVACVGGSWLTPKDAVEAGDWQRVEDLARTAAALA